MTHSDIDGPERESAPALSGFSPPEQRAIGPAHRGLKFSAWLLAGLVFLPILSLIIIAMGDADDVWPHIVKNVLPGSLATTLYLLALVSCATAIVGVVSAYLVVAFDFPFRRTLAWMLVLPLAVPPYLAAYALGEFFHYTGPVQSLVRTIFGFQTIRDYWFPDIRSTVGAAVVLSSVLYPYVYLTTRVIFLMQSRGVADAARTLGAGPWRVFFRIMLPLARPAIVAGVALVLMETINDIGAAEYLGVRTLTFSVYATWLNRGSLAGGAQIALVLLAVVAALLAAEHWARRKQRFAAARASQFNARPPRKRLAGFWRYGAPAGLFALILLGFGVPLYVFGRYLWRRLDIAFDARLLNALGTTVTTALITSVLTIAVALLLTYAARTVRGAAMQTSVRMASTGYALPGGVLAIGLLFLLGRTDGLLNSLSQTLTGASVGLLLTGSMAAVVIACTIRFIALAEGAISAGYDKMPPNIDAAVRNLGQSPYGSYRSIVLPLLTPAIMTAAVLVFVDTVKELSATILLRPIGFNTLATYVYEQASRSAPEEGAAAALMIVLVSLAPVALLSRMLADDRRTR